MLISLFILSFSWTLRARHHINLPVIRVCCLFLYWSRGEFQYPIICHFISYSRGSDSKAIKSSCNWSLLLVSFYVVTCRVPVYNYITLCPIILVDTVDRKTSLRHCNSNLFVILWSRVEAEAANTCPGRSAPFSVRPWRGSEPSSYSIHTLGRHFFFLP